jgi:hypothetical protein
VRLDSAKKSQEINEDIINNHKEARQYDTQHENIMQAQQPNRVIENLHLRSPN